MEVDEDDGHRNWAILCWSTEDRLQLNDLPGHKPFTGPFRGPSCLLIEDLHSAGDVGVPQRGSLSLSASTASVIG